MIRIAAIGLGNRACKYLEYVKSAQDEVRLEAVAEPNACRRSRIAESFSLQEGRVFASADELFNSSVEIDAVIIASPDRTHFPFTMEALGRGWHVLLEKPIASNMEECLKIRDLAAEKRLIVHVCYVLRFHPLYIKMKELLHHEGMGGITSIHHTINVGLDRMSHTFVRGLWSKESESSPIVLSKVSHDIDILCWMAEDRATAVNSYGSLEVFTSGNAPEGSSGRCTDCPLEKECRFSAVDLYIRRNEWNNGFNPLPSESKEEVIARKLKTGRFGRCVYRCDNDVADHQVIEMEMSSGAEVRIEMDGRSDKESRETVITCGNGSIRTDGSMIEMKCSGATETYDMSEFAAMPLHGGGDIALIREFIQSISGHGGSDVAEISSSIHSHRICFKADESQKKGNVKLTI